MVRTLLFQASPPPSYWVEALHVATHLLNILPTKTFQSSIPTSPYSSLLRGTIIFVYLVAPVTLTFQPQPLTSLLLAPRSTPSLDTLLTTRDIIALSLSPIGSSSHATLCLMRTHFLFPNNHPPPVQTISTSYLIILTLCCTQLVHQMFCCL
jgi:hypothetical protein